MDTLINNCFHREENGVSEDASHCTTSCTQTLIKTEFENETSVNNNNLAIGLMSKENVNDANSKHEVFKSDEEIFLNNDPENIMSTVDYNLSMDTLSDGVQERSLKSEDSNSLPRSVGHASSREGSEVNVSTSDDYLPIESSLCNCVQEETFVSEDSNSTAQSGEDTTLKENLEDESEDNYFLATESFLNNSIQINLKSKESKSTLLSDEQESLRENKVSVAEEPLLNAYREENVKTENCNCPVLSSEQISLNKNLEEKVPTAINCLSTSSINDLEYEVSKSKSSDSCPGVQVDTQETLKKEFQDKISIVDCPVVTESSSNYIPEDRSNIQYNESSLFNPIKRTFLRNDFEDEALSSSHCNTTESLFGHGVPRNKKLTFEEQPNQFDSFNTIMYYRNEIDELSQKCISKILAQKEKCMEKYEARYFEVAKQRSLNLAAQQSQFESVASESKTQLSLAYNSNPKDVIKSSKSILKSFKDDCRLFKKFYPASAFRNEVLSTLEDNQVLIVSADSYYSFNVVLPIFIKKQQPKVPLVCCENSEFTRSWLCESLIDFLGDKIVTSLSHKKGVKDQVLCLTEEEILEGFLNTIFQQRMNFIINVPLIRSVNCDILLANILDMLKLNEDSRLILLISPYTKMRDYQKYFSNFTTVSVLKTKCLTLPVTTVWKNNFLTPADDYVEEVVRTILAILVLKEHGDILAFLPQLEDLEQAAEILDCRLLELHQENVEHILIHENAICDFDIYSFITSTDSTRKIFLVTNCAETLFLLSVQHIVDCGIRNVYLYDNNAKTDMSNTIFISRKNADLRKVLAGACQPGVCYRIYSKNNYLEDMQCIDSPDVLMISPVNVMLKLFQYRPHSATSTKLIKSISENERHSALKLLEDCGAVKNKALTSIGENITKLPFEVNYSKLILLALEHDVVFETIVLVSFFTSGENIFLYSDDKKQQRIIDAKKLQLIQNDSDTITYLYIYKMYMDSNFSKEFCTNHFINCEALDSISSNIIEMCCIVGSCLDVNVLQSFSNRADSVLCITQLLFECFQNNLCVFTGHTESGYKMLYSTAFASIHSSSLISQWQILPQFIIYDHLHPTNNHLVHITGIPDDIIMNGLRSETLKYDFEELFEQILVKRTIEPIGEELMKNLTEGDNLKVIQVQVREECASDYIFLDLCSRKGHVYIYALPDCIDNAQCVVEDTVKSMLTNLLSENQIQILELKKAQNTVSVEVNWSKGAVASSISLCSQTPKSSVSSKNNVPIKNIPENPVSFPYYLCMSWMRRYCIGEGVVTFNDHESFMEARKLGMKYVRMLGKEVFIQLHNKDKYQLRLTGLPPETCNQNLKKELNVILPNSKIDKIELKYRSRFETSDEELQKIQLMITTIFTEYDLLDQCDIVIPKPEAKDVDMVAKIYTHDNKILNFIIEIILAEFVKNKKVISEVKFFVLVKCSPAIYNALGPRFISDLVQCESKLKSRLRTDLQFSFHADTETADTVTLNVSSSNNELMPLLHQTINNLLEGEILSHKNIKGLENLFFYGGHIWLRNLEKTENLYIVEDKQVKEIRLYGSEKSCNNAKIQIIEFLEDAENDVMLPIPLSGEINSSLLLKAIIKEYGINLETLIESSSLRSTFLDIKARQLLLRGSRDAVEKVSINKTMMC